MQTYIINKQIEAVIKEVEDLRCVNYNMYIGSGSDACDNCLPFDLAVDELKAFIKSKLQEAFKAGIKQEKINTGRIKKRQYENGFKAGQKSMEKEIVELIKKKYVSKRKENDGSDESWNVRAAYYNFALDDIIKSLSLTKESK
jgi:ribosomal protein L23